MSKLCCSRLLTIVKMPENLLCCHHILYMFILFAHTQLLLGVFYYIKAVVLFEDLLQTQFVGIQAIHNIEQNGYWNKTVTLNNVEYFTPDDVTNAYHNAAL